MNEKNEKIVFDASQAYNVAVLFGRSRFGAPSFSPSGRCLPAPFSFNEFCNKMKTRLISINAYEGSYWSQINGAKNLILDGTKHTGIPLSDKDDIGPIILAFATILSNSKRPQHKIFIDIYRCLYYNEYGVVDPLSIPFGWGLKDDYPTVI